MYPFGGGGYVLYFVYTRSGAKSIELSANNPDRVPKERGWTSPFPNLFTYFMYFMVPLPERLTMKYTKTTGGGCLRAIHSVPVVEAGQ